MKLKKWIGAVVVGMMANLAPLEMSAQGLFVFSNTIEEHEAPVYDIDCATPLGRGFFAQAYVGDAPSFLQPLEEPTPFGGSRGFFQQQSVHVPPPWDRQVYVQMRVWEAAAGPSYDAAVNAGGKHGVSSVITVWVWSGGGITPDETEFTSFCLIPEPSVVTLWAMGAGALGLIAFRRRRR